MRISRGRLLRLEDVVVGESFRIAGRAVRPEKPYSTA